MCGLFDPVSFDKNDGASLPDHAMGPDWLDLDFFFRPNIWGRTRILARWQRSAQGWGAPPGRTGPGGSPRPWRPMSRPSPSRGPQGPQSGLQARLACRPDWPTGRTGLQAGLACRPDWPAVRTGLQAGLACRPDSIHRRHTCIRLLDRNPTTSQKSNYSTKIQLCHKNPTTEQKPNYVTKTQLLNRNPTIPQTPDVRVGPRCQGRPPMSW